MATTSNSFKNPDGMLNFEAVLKFQSRVTDILAKAEQSGKSVKPISYYVISLKAKPAKYSASLDKKGDLSYLSHRSIKISSRKTVKDTSKVKILLTLVDSKELPAAFKQKLKEAQLAITAHVKKITQVKDKISKKRAILREKSDKDFDKATEVLSAILGQGGVKDKDIVLTSGMFGKSLLIKLNTDQYITVNKSDTSKFNAAKKSFAATSAYEAKCAYIDSLIPESLTLSDGMKTFLERQSEFYSVSVDTGEHLMSGNKIRRVEKEYGNELVTKKVLDDLQDLLDFYFVKVTPPTNSDLFESTKNSNSMAVMWTNKPLTHALYYPLVNDGWVRSPGLMGESKSSLLPISGSSDIWYFEHFLIPEVIIALCEEDIIEQTADDYNKEYDPYQYELDKKDREYKNRLADNLYKIPKELSVIEKKQEKSKKLTLIFSYCLRTLKNLDRQKLSRKIKNPAINAAYDLNGVLRYDSTHTDIGLFLIIPKGNTNYEKHIRISAVTGIAEKFQLDRDGLKKVYLEYRHRGLDIPNTLLMVLRKYLGMSDFLPKSLPANTKNALVKR